MTNFAKSFIFHICLFVWATNRDSELSDSIFKQVTSPPSINLIIISRSIRTKEDIWSNRQDYNVIGFFSVQWISQWYHVRGHQQLRISYCLLHFQVEISTILTTNSCPNRTTRLILRRGIWWAGGLKHIRIFEQTASNTSASPSSRPQTHQHLRADSIIHINFFEQADSNTSASSSRRTQTHQHHRAGEQVKEDEAEEMQQRHVRCLEVQREHERDDMRPQYIGESGRHLWLIPTTYKDRMQNLGFSSSLMCSAKSSSMNWDHACTSKAKQKSNSVDISPRNGY